LVLKVSRSGYYKWIKNKNVLNQYEIKVKNDEIKLDDSILGDSIKIEIINNKDIKVYIKTDKYREVK
jgi:hypothetical protein